MSQENRQLEDLPGSKRQLLFYTKIGQKKKMKREHSLSMYPEYIAIDVNNTPARADAREFTRWP